MNKSAFWQAIFASLLILLPSVFTFYTGSNNDHHDDHDNMVTHEQFRVCDPRLFISFLSMLCPSNRWRRDLSAAENIIQNTQRAKAFLQDKPHSRRKRQTGGADVYYIDECCISKGCSVDELTEYCMSVPL